MQEAGLVADDIQRKDDDDKEMERHFKFLDTIKSPTRRGMYMNLFRFNGRKIISVKNVGEMVAYNLYAKSGDPGWKSAMIPRPRKGETVIMAVNVKLAGPLSLLYLHKRYLKKSEHYDRLAPVEHVARLFQEAETEEFYLREHTWLIVVKPTQEFTIKLFGKEFSMKDSQSFISKDQTIELRPFEAWALVNGSSIPTKLVCGEYWEGGMSFSNWYLSQKVGVTIAYTNTNLPCRFYVVNKHAQEFEWVCGKKQVFEDDLFIVTATCSFDEEEEWHNGDGAITTWEIKWKESAQPSLAWKTNVSTSAGTLGDYKWEEIAKLRKQFAE